jgi:hypothetical protein
MDTVRIEYMMMSSDGRYVISNWQTLETNIMNDPQVYVPRGYQILQRYSDISERVRVRVVSEQTNQLVDNIG